MLVAAACVGLSEDRHDQNGQHNSTRLDAVKPPKVVTNAPAHSDFPVIGHLEKNDRTITIKSGPKGPLYTVKTKDGKVLFENLSAEQLRAQAPDLHEFIKNAVAGSSAKGETVIDASVGRTAPRR